MCFVFFLFTSNQVSTPLTIITIGNITTTPQKTDVVCQAPDVFSIEDNYVDIPTTLVAHVILGALSFGFLVPIGTLLPEMRRFTILQNNNRWFKSHYIIVVLGCLAGYAAFGLGLTNVITQFATSHGQLGMAIVVFSVWQILTGVFRPHLPKEIGAPKTKIREIWEYVHPIQGRVIGVLSASQVNI